MNNEKSLNQTTVTKEMNQLITGDKLCRKAVIIRVHDVKRGEWVELNVVLGRKEMTSENVADGQEVSWRDEEEDGSGYRYGEWERGRGKERMLSNSLLGFQNDWIAWCEGVASTVVPCWGGLYIGAVGLEIIWLLINNGHSLDDCCMDAALRFRGMVMQS